MNRQKYRIVIGKNFGDEGKGLAVDYFCKKTENTLVVKHNGGAQAGHTVDRQTDRFIFHQLSSGSFRKAQTFLAKTYYPDLYKLGEEVRDFEALAGFVPKLWCDAEANLVITDDILLNMALETMRGKNRHGSCGMGINEAFVRTKAGFGITAGEVLSGGAAALLCRWREIRREYLPKRLAEFPKGELPAEYAQLLCSEQVMENAAEEMLRNARLLTVSEPGPLFASAEQVIFETGQGLLLDSEYQRYAPHLTASRTGLYNPLLLLEEQGLCPDEVIYVSRSYVTRHGQGPLPCVCMPEEIGQLLPERTNAANPWQGTFRYARHESPAAFVSAVQADLQALSGIEKKPEVSLFLTHLNETEGKICFAQEGGVGDGRITPEELFCDRQIRETFSKWYGSYSPYAEDVTEKEL